MSKIPRACFLNKAWVNHEYQRRKMLRNALRRVTDILTGKLRTPALHREGFVQVRFDFSDYPVLDTPALRADSFLSIAEPFRTEGYEVCITVDDVGFEVLLDWRCAST